MRTIIFQKQFVEKILAGTKTTTIRKGDPAMFNKRFPAGAVVSLRYWTGAPYRTPQAEFAQARIAGVQEVILNTQTGSLKVAGTLADPARCDVLASEDGFESFAAMVAWFQGNHGPGLFTGVRLRLQGVIPVPGVLR